MAEYTTKYSVGDGVTTKHIDDGLVVGIFIDRESVTYLVRYKDNNGRIDEKYIKAAEITGDDI